VLVCSERKVLLADGCCWFVLREKYCLLVADKPSEQGVNWLVRNLLVTAPRARDKTFPPVSYDC
jgi:hypothetical protein